jgi:hypothetical protein
MSPPEKERLYSLFFPSPEAYPLIINVYGGGMYQMILFSGLQIDF